MSLPGVEKVHVIEAISICYILSYKSQPFVKHEFLMMTTGAEQ